jgi:hypothetical protein
MSYRVVSERENKVSPNAMKAWSFKQFNLGLLLEIHVSVYSARHQPQHKTNFLSR